jgi:hypothetical protein
VKEEEIDTTAGTLGSFASNPCLTHLSVSAHTLFGPEDTSEHSFSAVLPPGLQYLTIVDDLHLLKAVDKLLRIERFFALLRSYLIGDTMLERYGESDENRELTDAWVVSVKGGDEGEWVTSTHALKEFMFDCRTVEVTRTGYDSKGRG